MSTNWAYFQESWVLPPHSQQGRQWVTVAFARGRDVTFPAGNATYPYEEVQSGCLTSQHFTRLLWGFLNTGKMLLVPQTRSSLCVFVRRRREATAIVPPLPSWIFSFWLLILLGTNNNDTEPPDVTLGRQTPAYMCEKREDPGICSFHQPKSHREEMEWRACSLFFKNCFLHQRSVFLFL